MFVLKDNKEKKQPERGRTFHCPADRAGESNAHGVQAGSIPRARAKERGGNRGHGLGPRWLS